MALKMKIIHSFWRERDTQLGIVSNHTKIKMIWRKRYRDDVVKCKLLAIVKLNRSSGDELRDEKFSAT